jgi:hypothetical protein
MSAETRNVATGEVDVRDQIITCNRKWAFDRPHVADPNVMERPRKARV